MVTITKQSETYTIEDLLETGWKISGTLSTGKTVKTISLSVYNEELGIPVGSYSWSRNDNNIYVNYNISDNQSEVDFINAISPVIEEVKQYSVEE